MKLHLLGVLAFVLLLSGCDKDDCCPDRVGSAKGSSAEHATASIAEPGQHAASFQRPIIVSGQYLIYLPKDYAANKERYPLILFLHGSGERGENIDLVAVHGPPKLAKEKDFPFIIVSPQCPPDEAWSPRVLNGLLDEISAKYRVDAERVYVTGLSLGGMATWALAINNPHRFAAIAPICGFGDSKRVARIGKLPVWVFHGAKDKAVPIARMEATVKALKDAGGDVNVTVYPDLEHDSWTTTYNNPELYEWFLKHRRILD